MYDRALAEPSDEAHAAAESMDAVFEALSDGVSVTDLAILPKLLPFISYVFNSENDKGESISRALQLISLVERDNALLKTGI